MISVKKLPDDLVQEIKRIAHEVTRPAYERKRDELMQRATLMMQEGGDVQRMLAEEWRASMLAGLRSTREPARARDRESGSVLPGAILKITT